MLQKCFDLHTINLLQSQLVSLRWQKAHDPFKQGVFWHKYTTVSTIPNWFSCWDLHQSLDEDSTCPCMFRVTTNSDEVSKSRLRTHQPKEVRKEKTKSLNSTSFYSDSCITRTMHCINSQWNSPSQTGGRKFRKNQTTMHALVWFRSHVFPVHLFALSHFVWPMEKADCFVWIWLTQTHLYNIAHKDCTQNLPQTQNKELILH